MKYDGELYFDDGDVISVISFIVRESEIAFDLIASWDGDGQWRRSGVALIRGSSFESELNHSTSEVDGSPGVACRLKFQFTDIDNGYIEVSGTWEEESETHHFQGELQATDKAK